jgi:hypothetical protein
MILCLRRKEEQKPVLNRQDAKIAKGNKFSKAQRHKDAKVF